MICDCRAGYVQCKWIFVCVRQVYRCAGEICHPQLDRMSMTLSRQKRRRILVGPSLFLNMFMRTLHGGGYFHNPLVSVHNDFSEDGE